MRYYYTFGSDHFHEGESLRSEYVVVQIDKDINVDPRALFMGWRGSNAFAFEYDERTWADRVYPSYYEGKEPFIVITVEKRK